MVTLKVNISKCAMGRFFGENSGGVEYALLQKPVQIKFRPVRSMRGKKIVALAVNERGFATLDFHGRISHKLMKALTNSSRNYFVVSRDPGSEWLTVVEYLPAERLAKPSRATPWLRAHISNN